MRRNALLQSSMPSVHSARSARPSPWHAAASSAQASSTVAMHATLLPPFTPRYCASASRARLTALPGCCPASPLLGAACPGGLL
jgi:hypothetical protein